MRFSDRDVVAQGQTYQLLRIARIEAEAIHLTPVTSITVSRD